MFGLQLFLRASSSNNQHAARMPCSVHYMIHLSRHLQSTSTSSSPLCPCKLDAICFSAVWPICRTNPFSQGVSPTLRLKRAVKQHLLFNFQEGAVSNLLVMTSPLLLMRLRRVTDRTSEGRPHHCFYWSETSANPFSASVSHSHSGIEKEIARNHNQKKVQSRLRY